MLLKFFNIHTSVERCVLICSPYSGGFIILSACYKEEHILMQQTVRQNNHAGRKGISERTLPSPIQRKGYNKEASILYGNKY